ncbi:MAG: lipopolysaccharide biosynthesis protein [Bacillota bacterium]|nr:lipopolysaccharide biosynthesis protein [Bacillota bacterium]
MIQLQENGRINKGIKNIINGLVLQFISIGCNFATRYLLVHMLGKEAVGLNGLFTEVISMLSLMEMGVGTAITYNLYKPLTDKDEVKVGQLMRLFSHAYYIIAAAVLIIGGALVPFIQLLIKDISAPLSYVRLIYFLFVCKTATSYLFAYKSMLLDADQKNYVSSRVNAGFKIVAVFADMIVLFATKSFVFFLITDAVFVTGSNILTAYLTDKHYPYLKRKTEKLPAGERRKVFANIKYLFISTLSGKITNSTDNILISKLISTLQVGSYSNYSMIINAISGITSKISGTLTGGVGNMMATESSEYCSAVLKRMTFIFYMAASVCGVCLYCMLTPFVVIMFGKSYVLSAGVVFVSVVNFFLMVVRDPLWKIMTTSGLFRKDKNISIAGSLINLVISIILGLKIGMVGIFLGTTATHVIQIILKIRLLYRERFHMKCGWYYIMFTKMTVIYFAEIAIAAYLCVLLPGWNMWIRFIAVGTISALVPVAVNVLIYYRTSEFKYMVELFEKIVLKRKKA